MHFIQRRDFVRGLALGAGATLLSPLCSRLIRDARGQASTERRLIVFTANQGWNSEADDDDVTATTPKGQRSRFFGTQLRSENDYDLPKILQPLAGDAREISILFGLRNFEHVYDGVPHGSGLATLTAMGVDHVGDDWQPRGPSIDRFLGKELQKRYGDVIDSVNMATLMYGQYPTSTSVDGPQRLATCYASPLKAYLAYFGQATAQSPQDLERNLALDQSLFDAMIGDIEKVRTNLAGFEKQKFDQVLDSCRELEQKLQARGSVKMSGKPGAPTVDNGDLEPDTIRGFVDLLWQVHAFGLTHVSHFAFHGNSVESDSRIKLVPTVRDSDTHNAVYHNDYQPDILDIVHYKASQLAYVRQKLKEIASGGGSLADETLIVWINAGGSIHHRGYHTHPVVLIGSLGGALRAPLYIDYTEYSSADLNKLVGTRHVADAFVSIAQAMNVDISTFGDSAECKGPLPGVVA